MAEQYHFDGEIEKSEPKKIKILKAGKFHHPGMENGVLEITHSDLDAMIANFQKDMASGYCPPWDYVHAMKHAEYSNDPANAGKRAGKMVGLEKDGDFLVAATEWTDAAKCAIEADEYGYCSASFSLEHVDVETMQKGGAKLYGASLTNTPHLKMLGMVECSDKKEETVIQLYEIEPKDQASKGEGEKMSAEVNVVELQARFEADKVELSAALDAEKCKVIELNKSVEAKECEVVELRAKLEKSDKAFLELSAQLLERDAEVAVDAKINGGYLMAANKEAAVSLYKLDKSLFDQVYSKPIVDLSVKGVNASVDTDAPVGYFEAAKRFAEESKISLADAVIQIAADKSNKYHSVFKNGYNKAGK